MAKKQKKPSQKPKNKGGRPTKYSPELADKICERIATSSDGVHKVAESLEIGASTCFEWLDKHPEFADKYARAKERQADFMVQEMIEIADDASRDEKIIQKNGSTTVVENTEWTNRSKLRVETRKWLAGKLRPKVYGDSLKLQGDKENPVQVQISGMEIK
jgi:transposase-like protein